MRTKAASLIVALCLVASTSALSNIVGSRRVKQWQLNQRIQQESQSSNSKRADLETDFPPQFFEQPLDHFDKNRKDTFQQRYWVSTRNYKPRKGAPVVILDGGETSGSVSEIIF